MVGPGFLWILPPQSLDVPGLSSLGVPIWCAPISRSQAGAAKFNNENSLPPIPELNQRRLHAKLTLPTSSYKSSFGVNQRRISHPGPSPEPIAKHKAKQILFASSKRRVSMFIGCREGVGMSAVNEQGGWVAHEMGARRLGGRR